MHAPYGASGPAVSELQQARVDGLGLQRQDAEDELAHPAGAPLTDARLLARMTHAQALAAQLMAAQGRDLRRAAAPPPRRAAGDPACGDTDRGRPGNIDPELDPPDF